jgi:hypothetical protein
MARESKLNVGSSSYLLGLDESLEPKVEDWITVVL